MLLTVSGGEDRMSSLLRAAQNHSSDACLISHLASAGDAYRGVFLTIILIERVTAAAASVVNGEWSVEKDARAV